MLKRMMTYCISLTLCHGVFAQEPAGYVFSVEESGVALRESVSMRVAGNIAGQRALTEQFRTVNWDRICIRAAKAGFTYNRAGYQMVTPGWRFQPDGDAERGGNNGYSYFQPFTFEQPACGQMVRTDEDPSPTSSIELYSLLNPTRPEVAASFEARVFNNVGGPISGGTVDFIEDVITRCSDVPVVAGKASCAFTPNSGARVVQARFSGNDSWSASESFFTQYVSEPQYFSVPGRPRGIRVIVGNRKLTVCATPPVNTGWDEVFNYDAEYRLASAVSPHFSFGCSTNGASGGSAEELCCEISDLENDELYLTRMQAVNETGVGEPVYGSLVAPTADDIIVSTSSTSPLALSGLGGGKSRSVTFTNQSSTPLTVTSVGTPTPALPGSASIDSTATNSCTASKVLAVNESCTLTIKPGTAATSSSGCATTPSTLPDPSAIPVVFNSGGTPLTATANVVILGYGCQYQGGYLYSIDDATPISGSIGGSVVTAKDQSTSVKWSPSNDIVYGVAQNSTIGTPSPNTNQATNQTACNGNKDGSCNTRNIAVSYPLTANNAAGICRQPIDANGNTPCGAGIACYSDWYLPSICEMGYDMFSRGSACGTAAQPLMQNIVSNLFDKGLLSNFSGNYWSSSEDSGSPQDVAWYQYFASGGSFQNRNAKGNTLRVRCSRALTL